MFRIARFLLLTTLSLCAGARADEAKPKVEADGTITTAIGSIPFSAAASMEALKRFHEIQDEDRASPGMGKPLAARAFYDKINSDRARRMRKLFPVAIEHRTLGGVPVDVVTPASDKADGERVLVNLHGGAFLWGAGSGGLVEAIPVASVAKLEVVTVDYREGPEDRFPAASEDVEKVYRELLKHYRPEHIGIYGCSAGGALTAQAVAWFEDRKLPMPGAIGIFCAGVGDDRGDSQSIAPLLMGQPLPKIESGASWRSEHPYFKGVDMHSPLVLPGLFPAVLAKFPPTLLISGTRDMELSAVLRSNELLTEAGVPTELHVWEGMWHSFFSDPELPESRAAYAVMARFFQRHLGGPPAAASKRR